MSTKVSESFIKQFEADVHLAYQQSGSKLLDKRFTYFRRHIFFSIDKIL